MTPVAYKPNQQSIAKSNALITASYRLSLNEQRVIIAALSQVRNDEQLTDQKMYFVTADDIVLEKNATNRFRELRRVCDSLFERSIVIEGVPNGATPIGNNPMITGTLRTRWIQSEVVYFEGEGKIAFRLSHDVIPYLNQLRREFTRFPLTPVYNMSSTYAIRIFEMLMQFKNTGVLKVSISDLRKRLVLEKKYPRFQDFRRNIIELSVEQINEHAGLGVSVEYHKKGRSFDAVTFKFKKKVAKNIDANTKNKPSDNNEDQLNLRGYDIEKIKEYAHLLGLEDDLNEAARRVEALNNQRNK